MYVFTRQKKIYGSLIAGLVMMALLVAGGFGCGAGTGEVDEELVLTYQTWSESLTIGNIFHILLEEKTDIPIRAVELESFSIQWEAMIHDEVDILPSFTASAYMNVLGDEGLRDPEEVYDYVSQRLEEEYNVILLEQLGYYNNYDLAVRPEVAEEYGLETYSDLAEVSDELIITADANFLDIPAGYPLLQDVYGMDFKDIKTVGVALKYPVIEDGQADVINNYTTDAQIVELGLVVLEDDQFAFPSYDAVPFVRKETLEKYPEIKEVLNLLAGQFSNDEMREMNYRVEIDEEDPEDVARDFLIQKGLIGG